MKNLILLISILLAVSCGKSQIEKFVGEYELKEDGNTERVVLLDNGIMELYKNGKKDEVEHKWKISKEGEIHATDYEGDIFIFRINKDRSITIIARIGRGKERTDWPKEEQPTYKKNN